MNTPISLLPRNVSTTREAIHVGEREAYIDKVRSEARECSEEVKRLEEQATRASAKARISYEEQVADLQRRCGVLTHKLEDLQWGDEAWEDAKRGVQDALDSLKEGIEKARSRFG